MRHLAIWALSRSRPRGVPAADPASIGQTPAPGPPPWRLLLHPLCPGASAWPAWTPLPAAPRPRLPAPVRPVRPARARARAAPPAPGPPSPQRPLAFSLLHLAQPRRFCSPTGAPRVDPARAVRAAPPILGEAQAHRTPRMTARVATPAGTGLTAKDPLFNDRDTLSPLPSPALVRRAAREQTGAASLCGQVGLRARGERAGAPGPPCWPRTPPGLKDGAHTGHP